MARKKSVTCQRGGTCASFSLVNVAFDPTLIPGIHVLHILSSFHTAPREMVARFIRFTLFDNTRSFMPGGGKVRGYSTHLYTGRLRPDVRPLTLLCTISERKGIPFVYLPLTNLTPLTYLA